MGMIALTNSCRYFVYQEFCNMRMSFNGLGGLVNNHMDANLLSGDIFIFINRRKNQCKLLRYCDDGFELYHKKLTKGTFEVPASGEIEVFQLQLMLSGILVDKFKKKDRFYLKNVG
jgi:transposase